MRVFIPTLKRRDRWNQNMFSPAIHCRVGIRPPCRGFNPMHSPAIYRRDRWNQNMFSPAIHCRVGIRPPCRGFNPMHSPAIYRRDRWNQNMFSPAIHCRDWESALCVGVLTPCIARRFNAGIGIAPHPLHRV